MWIYEGLCIGLCRCDWIVQLGGGELLSAKAVNNVQCLVTCSGVYWNG